MDTMNRVEFLRKWCLTTTCFDYSCRSCVKCLRKARLPVRVNREDPVIVIQAADGRYEHLEDYAWDIERQVFRTFLVRRDLKYIVNVVYEYEVCMRRGIFCTFHAHLSCAPVHHNNDELIGGQPSIAGETLETEEPVMELKYFNCKHIPDEIQRKRAILERVKERIQDAARELEAPKERRQKQSRRLGRQNILIDVNARQYGCYLREIDLKAMIDILIPGCLNISLTYADSFFRTYVDHVIY